MVTPRKSSILFGEPQPKARRPRHPVSPHLPHHVWRNWRSTDAAAAAKAFFTRPRNSAVRELMRVLCSDDPY
ncbi:MAG TPA: hypothetical protein VFJ10_06175, partial [Acidobacteriaceae bacterium]|nr:hypothetical protein [Acidobacteriaceae bacterium]